MLHHLAIGANDVDALAAFYTEIFNLELCARHAYDDGATRSIWLWLSNSREAVLMIEHTDLEPSPIDGPIIVPGPFLLAFSIAQEQREALLEKLAARGHEVEASTGYTSYFRDPENNRVAVSTYPLQDRHID